MIAEILEAGQILCLDHSKGKEVLLKNLSLDPESHQASLYLLVQGKHILLATLKQESQVNSSFSLSLPFQEEQDLWLTVKNGTIHIIGNYEGQSKSESKPQQEAKQLITKKSEPQIPQISQNQPLRRSSRQRTPKIEEPPKRAGKKQKQTKQALNGMAQWFDINENDLDDDEEDQSISQKAKNQVDDSSSQDDDGDSDFQMKKKREFQTDKQKMDSKKEIEQNGESGRKRRKNNDQQEILQVTNEKKQSFSKPTKNPYDYCK